MMALARNLPAEQTSSNLHAILSLLALKNVTETEYENLFSPEEKILINHLVETVISIEPGNFKWACEKFFNRALPFSWQRMFLDKTFSPEYVQQVLASKYMIKSKALHEIKQQQVEQIVFINSEYYSTGFSIARENPIPVFEIVPERIAEIKLKAFLALPNGFGSTYKDFHHQPSHTTINQNYCLIKHDFEKDNLQESLLKVRFNPEKNTLFIVEGVTKYLSAINNTKLLTHLFHLSKLKNEVLISYRSNLSNPILGSALQYANQESFQFFLTTEQIADFAAEKEFLLTAKMLPDDLLDWIKAPHAENSATGEHYYLLKKLPCLINMKSDIHSLPLITQNFPVINLPVNNKVCTLF